MLELMLERWTEAKGQLPCGGQVGGNQTAAASRREWRLMRSMNRGSAFRSRSKYPFIPKVCSAVRRPDKPSHDGDAEGKRKNRQCKNTDGPPRHVQMLGAIGNWRGTHARVARRYARHLLRRRVRMVLAAVVAMRDGSGRQIIVIVVVVLVVCWIERAIVGTPVVATRRRVLGLLGVVRVVLLLLARLFALATLHPGLLEQTALFCQPPALLPILPLVLPDQCFWLVSKDVLEFAELADPRVVRRAMGIGVLLLDAALVRSMLVQLRGTTLRFRGRRGLLLRLGALLGRSVPVGRRCVGAVHPRARLRALRGHHGRVRADRRAGAGGLGVRRLTCIRGRVGTWGLRVLPILLPGPDHLVGRVGAAGEGKLRLVGAVLGGFLLQQAHVLVAVGRRGCLGVGDGGRDDAALLRCT